MVTVASAADTSPPVVQINTPADGATVSGLVIISATATDDVGVARVDFFVDGVSIGSAMQPPFSVPWNSAGALAPAGHVLSARATDTSGNVGNSQDVTVTVAANADTTVPTVAITAPSNGAKIRGRFTLTAAATDDLGVARVVLLLDGVELTTLAAPPYSFEVDGNALTLGDHTLGAKAFDAAGNEGDAIAVGVLREPPEEVTGTCGCTSSSSALAAWLAAAFVVALRRPRRKFARR
jgi:MYXO-CTERM domain-containing protein